MVIYSVIRGARPRGITLDISETKPMSDSLTVTHKKPQVTDTEPETVITSQYL